MVVLEELPPRGRILHIVSLALGGCLKAEPVRYGITEDTGGHITYILGEMEALAERDDVHLAEIITRRFEDAKLGPIHGQAEEWLSPKLVIRRIDSGNTKYLSKEALSVDRPAFVQALIAELRSRDRLPDLIHAHFADAADVAKQVEAALGIPFIYTAHSLGMDKCATGTPPNPCMAARIAEEDRAIAGARAIIGSSRDECERQLLAYPSSKVGKIHRLIPGIDRHFSDDGEASALGLLEPFLRDPTKPMVLAIARPVQKKNLLRLVEAFAASSSLRARCNLVLIAGLREGLDTGEQEQREVMRGLIEAIDRHDLYGSVAYPKSHDRQQVQALYSLATQTRGVFVNPALMEPYGLTLAEAAAHGLPVVATMIGGPQDIVGDLQHGLLVDPCDTQAIKSAIERLIEDDDFWDQCSSNGRNNSEAMNWTTYAEGFAHIASEVVGKDKKGTSNPSHLLVSDLDNTLTGCRSGVARFKRFLSHENGFGLVVATGRSFVEARRLVRDWGLPSPLAWITSVGSEIYIERDGELVLDDAYARKIADGWAPQKIDNVLRDFPGLTPQSACEQRAFKRSYIAASCQVATAVEQRLHDEGIGARVVFSHERLLDVLPIKAGKAAAMHHVASFFGMPVGNVFAAGDSGNDSDMLGACENAILVGNHAAEVAELANRPNVYVSRRNHASGALEGLLAHHRAQRMRARQLAEVAI